MKLRRAIVTICCYEAGLIVARFGLDRLQAPLTDTASAVEQWCARHGWTL